MRNQAGQENSNWKNAQKKRHCTVCKKPFVYYPSEKSGRFCSRRCYGKFAVKNLGKRFSGMKHKPETIAKMKMAQVGRKHWNWVDANVNYQSLHTWVERHKGKPNKCEHCNTTKGKFEWANVSKKYKRDLNDFIRLCKPCHRKFDTKK